MKMVAHWTLKVVVAAFRMLPVHLVKEKTLVHVHVLLVFLELKQVLPMMPLSLMFVLHAPLILSAGHAQHAQALLPVVVLQSLVMLAKETVISMHQMVAK